MTRGAFFFVSVFILFAAGCTKHKRVESAPSNVWVRWAMEREPTSLDWTVCRDSACRNLSSLVMEGLTVIDGVGEERKAVAALAASWENETPTKLVFHLRPGVRWADGDSLTAAQFTAAWKRLLSHCHEVPEAQRLFAIVNAASFCDGRAAFSTVGIETPDPQTIILRLRAADPLLPIAMADPTTWPARPRGGTLGRFTLEKWGRGELRFARNPRFHSEPAEAAGVIVRIVPSAEARVQLYLDREIDLADDLPPAVAGQLAGNPELVAEPTANVVALIFNTSRKPFQALAARQAFTMALKKDEPLTLLRWPHLPTDQLLPSPTPTSTAKPQVAKALELLAKMEPVQHAHPTLTWTAGDDEKEVAENLQAQWIKNLEVKVELVAPKPRESAASMTLARIVVDPLRPAAHVDAIAARARLKTKSIEPTLAAANELFVTKELAVFPLYQETRSSLRRPLAQNLRKQSPDLLEN